MRPLQWRTPRTLSPKSLPLSPVTPGKQNWTTVRPVSAALVIRRTSQGHLFIGPRVSRRLMFLTMGVSALVATRRGGSVARPLACPLQRTGCEQSSGIVPSGTYKSSISDDHCSFHGAPWEHASPRLLDSAHLRRLLGKFGSRCHRSGNDRLDGRRTRGHDGHVASTLILLGYIVKKHRTPRGPKNGLWGKLHSPPKNYISLSSSRMKNCVQTGSF